MKLSLCTDVLGDLSYPQMLDKVKSLGLSAVEMTAGGWSSCPHVKTAELLADENKFKAFKDELVKRDMEIVALNCSGNPLAPGKMGDEHTKTARLTVDLSEKLGLKKIVMMSGLPAGAEGDKIPNWITTTATLPYLDFMNAIIDYQWNKVAIPWWKEFANYASSHGIEQIALEEFPNQLVYNPQTFLRLRNAVGKIIGINLDPSHLMIMGADPIAAIRPLEGAIYHVHGKDARIERGLCDVDGLMEYKPVTDTRNRSWNYVAVGCGRDLQWWKEFFSVLSMTGYNDYVSLEMEDLTMSVDAGIETSIAALKQTISR
jgi:sugar phosphate isomerase/epimerase